MEEKSTQKKPKLKQYTSRCQSPMGELLLTADSQGLTGAWFPGAKYCREEFLMEYEENGLPVFEQAREWLGVYFSGKEPDFMPPLHLYGSPFQLAVWEILRKIPYGQTVTYGEIAKEIARQRGISRMSAQAVGGAVGRNPVSILVPCHRVLGADRSLTGYASGLDKKRFLLDLEGIEFCEKS